MEFRSNRRILIFSVITLALFAWLIIQLGNLTLAQGKSLEAQSEQRTKRTMSITASRGTIMDKNGIPLAYDEKCYNVQFVKDPTRTSSEDRAFYTAVLMRAIGIIESNGGKIVNVFSIKRDAEGKFYFDFDTTDPGIATKRETRWRKDMFVSVKSYPAPEDIYNYLRMKYQIPEELNYDQAYKLLSIWQEIQLNAGKMYQPVDVAYNVNIVTVAQLKTYANELEGIKVDEGTVRIYPKDNTAAHIIGYLGKMNDPEEIAQNEALGYDPGDLIGVNGIEQTMEKYLTCNTTEKKGTKEVEVTRSGKISREFPGKEAQSGDSVMLTIDLKLQIEAERILKDDIDIVRKVQEGKYADKKEDYDKEVADRGGKDIQFAQTGAAVVMEANTGRVLALASYPDYNLNLFTGGISEKDYAPLKDPATSPLFNKAISSKGTPGSIFKMVTGLGGLMENKITVDETIDDQYRFRFQGETEATEDAPKCWQKNSAKHQDQDIVKAIKNSCNFYFYTVAERLGIKDLDKWADKLGLTSKTGIELPAEAQGQVGNQKMLYDDQKEVYDKDKKIPEQNTSIPKLVYNKIKATLKVFGEQRKVNYTDAELIAATDEIIKLADDEDKSLIDDNIRRILREKLGISERISEQYRWDKQIQQEWLTQLMWTPNMTVASGIGQGVDAVTPIAVARYVAAIVNGGTVYNAHIVDKIIDPDGTIIEEKKPEIFSKLDANPLYLDKIKQGMGQVVSAEDNGTAADYFKDFEYEKDIGGKTGTAQVSDIDLENNSWFVAFTPYEKPEIVVVAYIPHGYSGSQSALIARDIIKYYRDNQKRKAKDDIPVANSIIGDLYKEKTITDANGSQSSDAKTQDNKSAANQ